MEKLKSFLEKNAGKLLVSAIILYFITFSLICLWKYYNFQYDLLDLAIINQVFLNSAGGDLFASSIHPPSYLGDHFTPILILLFISFLRASLIYLLSLMFTYPFTKLPPVSWSAASHSAPSEPETPALKNYTYHAFPPATAA